MQRKVAGDTTLLMNKSNSPTHAIKPSMPFISLRAFFFSFLLSSSVTLILAAIEKSDCLIMSSAETYLYAIYIEDAMTSRSSGNEATPPQKKIFLQKDRSPDSNTARIKPIDQIFSWARKRPCILQYATFSSPDFWLVAVNYNETFF